MVLLDLPESALLHTLGYCSSKELCALDSTCSSTKELADDAWRRLSAFLRIRWGLAAVGHGFGGLTGKDSFRKTFAIVSGHQVSFQLNDGVGGDYCKSSPFVACNDRIVVHSSFDLWEHLQHSTKMGETSALTRTMAGSEDVHEEPKEEAMFAFHSSSDLLPAGYVKGPESSVASLVVCGTLTVVAVSGLCTLTAFHDSETTTINMRPLVGGNLEDYAYCPAKALGSDKALVILCMGHLLLYETDLAGGWVKKPPALVAPAIPEYRANVHDSMCWSATDKSEFAFWDRKPIVSVWKIVGNDHDASLAHQETLQSMQGPVNNSNLPSVISGMKGNGISVVFNGGYVAVSDLKAPFVGVYRRGTDTLVHSLNSPKPKGFGGRVMIAHGDLLIISCFPGLSVSIWHMEGGTLLNHFQVNLAPCLALQVLCLSGTSWDFPAFLWCTTKGFFVTAFPWNDKTKEHLLAKRHLHSRAGGRRVESLT